jgi:hypothetical protein
LYVSYTVVKNLFKIALRNKVFKVRKIFLEKTLFIR